MLRELSTVLEDLHEGVRNMASHASEGVRIFGAEMTLPVDTALAFKNGSCALLADVTRSHADAAWHETPSRLTLTWAEMPTEDLP